MEHSMECVIVVWAAAVSSEPLESVALGTGVLPAAYTLCAVPLVVPLPSCDAAAVAKEEARVRVDNAKKRHILSAPSYDDFKNLVAAAHQKPVSRKDMDTLRGAPRSITETVVPGTAFRSSGAVKEALTATAAPASGDDLLASSRARRSQLGRRRKR